MREEIGSNKPQVLNVTRENMYYSPELRNCEVSWDEPGVGEREVENYAERLE